MLELLCSYDFLVVAAGTMILAATSAVAGCLCVYKGQSLLGDAIGHSSYPGIVLAFICFATRNPLLLTVGAALAGAVAYKIIQVLARYGHVGLDASLAIVLTGFFGLGMALKTYVQGDPAYAKASQAGLKNYIFGSAAFMMKEDVVVIAVFSLLAIVLFELFRKELVTGIFDPSFAGAISLRAGLLDGILLVIMISLIALGLKCVGAVLISSLLVIPCICANQHSRKLDVILKIAAATGALSAFVGTLVSTAVRGVSTGPAIIICMGLAAFVSMVFGRWGLLRRWRQKAELRSCLKSSGR